MNLLNKYIQYSRFLLLQTVKPRLQSHSCLKHIATNNLNLNLNLISFKVLVQSDLCLRYLWVKSILSNLSYLDYFSLISNLNNTKLVEKSDWTYMIFISSISRTIIHVRQLWMCNNLSYKYGNFVYVLQNDPYLMEKPAIHIIG